MLKVLLIAIVLSAGPDDSWEPVPSHKIAVPDTVGRREEFKPLRRLAICAIGLYRRTLSRSQGDVCNFTPSCSHYGQEAIKRYGLVWGTLMAVDRLERCNYNCQRYSPEYYGVKWAEGRGFKLYDPPERNWFFRNRASRPGPRARP